MQSNDKNKNNVKNVENNNVDLLKSVLNERQNATSETSNSSLNTVNANDKALQDNIETSQGEENTSKEILKEDKTKKQKSKKRKVGDIIAWVLVGLLSAFVAVVLIMLMIGFRPAVVLTPSMTPNIMPGDMVVFKKVDAEKLKVGDVITFYMTQEAMDKKGTSFTHRIIEIIPNGDGTYSFRTQGDANETPDSSITPESRVLGKVQFVVPWVGRLFLFIKNNLLVIIGCIISIVLLCYLLSMLYKQLKSQPQAESVGAMGANVNADKENSKAKKNAPKNNNAITLNEATIVETDSTNVKIKEKFNAEKQSNLKDDNKVKKQHKLDKQDKKSDKTNETSAEIDVKEQNTNNDAK